MKKLVEGNELLNSVPVTMPICREPVVHLMNGLALDDENCFQSPVLIQGNVGTGKTTLQQDIMKQILPFAKRTGDNVVIFCPKPDMLEFAEPGDIIVSINNLDPASCWNMFREFENAADPYTAIREIAADLFREAEERSTQIFFPQAARDMFVRTCMYMTDYEKRTGNKLSNADFVKFIETTTVKGTDDVPGWLDLADMHPEYFSVVRDYLGEGSEQGRGVLSELRTMVSTTFYGSFASPDGSFSSNVLKTGSANIFLYYNYSESGHSFLHVMKILTDLLLKQGMDPFAKHKTWYFFDEGSLLPQSDVLVDALSMGRDPGGKHTNGVRIIMTLQSARLMARHYSEKEAKMLLSLFPNVISFKVVDPMSRAVLSERYGKARYQYSYAGIGDRTHYVDCVEDVISDFHFSSLAKKGQAIVSMPGVCSKPFLYDGYKEET